MLTMVVGVALWPAGGGAWLPIKHCTSLLDNWNVFACSVGVIRQLLHEPAFW